VTGRHWLIFDMLTKSWLTDSNPTKGLGGEIRWNAIGEGIQRSTTSCKERGVIRHLQLLFEIGFDRQIFTVAIFQRRCETRMTSAGRSIN
jgi:hypothetical protein